MQENKEADAMAIRYEKRKADKKVVQHSANYIYNHFIQAERELVYLDFLHKLFNDFSKVRIIEIGAGHGTNLYFMKKAGISWKNIVANELLPDRIAALKRDFPMVTLHEGDASTIRQPDNHEAFDVVFQSTVFTSILNNDIRQKLARVMWNLVKPGGMVLWYDFVYDNPANPDVKKVTRQEVKQLFPNADKILFKSVTLAPPIGRRIGKWYPLFNLFPFLRTHVVAAIYKK
jgi:2-polyprenyl-3-methyl-5-hydroxy-6-metoxy-1,4-benzoquinol methylase